MTRSAPPPAREEMKKKTISFPTFRFSMTFGVPIVANLVGDQYPEIVFRGGYILPGTGTEKLFLLDHEANLLPGWPITTAAPSNLVISSPYAPLIGDIDGDGLVEMVLTGDANQIFAWDFETSYDGGRNRARLLGDNRNSAILPGASVPTDAPDDGLLPATVTLRQNYANPFNPATTISFTLPRRTKVVLEVFNLLGQRVETLLSADLPAGEHHPMVRAVVDGAVCMVNPFACKPLHKKASLAVLSDERNQARFSPAERAAIATHVPWTRVVEERRTVVDGAEVDLLPWLAGARESLVLKPNDDYGGKGIVLGWEVSDSEWEAALRTALAEPHIVQQRIELPVESFPALTPDCVRYDDRIVDTAPFVFNGAYVDGCLTRISTASLVNVTAGGGSTVPTFVVEPRP